MKLISLILTIIGISLLLLVPILTHPLKIEKESDLKSLNNNQKVEVTSKVVSEVEYSKYGALTLENKIKIICKPSCPTYKGNNVTIIGQLDNYYERPRIIALKIK